MQAAFLGILRARAGYCEARGSWAAYSSYFIRDEIRLLIGIKNSRLPPLMLSLDAPIAEDSEETRLDLLPDETATNAEESAEFSDMRRCVREAVAQLKDARQRQVAEEIYLRGRAGKDVAAALGVSQARVNGIWNAARQHLARNRRLRALEDLTPYYRHVGVSEFERTWTSTTEAAVLWRLESEVKLNADADANEIPDGAV